MTTIETAGETLDIDGTRVRFRHPIKDVVHAEGVIVVLLDVPPGSIDNRNVIGVSEDGERLWEIDPISDDPTADQAYVNLYEKGGGVWVGNPIGAECRLDPATGNLTEKLQKK